MGGGIEECGVWWWAYLNGNYGEGGEGQDASAEMCGVWWWWAC